MRVYKVLAAAVLTAAGCCTERGIPSSEANILADEVTHKPLVIGYEGLQPFSGYRVKNLTEALSIELGFADSATTGNRGCHMPYIEKASQSGQPIHIIGYSLGAAEARALAQDCEKKSIVIDDLILLDDTTAGEISANVQNVHVFRGTVPYTFRGPAYTQDNLANSETVLHNYTVDGASHMSLPEQALPEIARILRTRQKLENVVARNQ